MGHVILLGDSTLDNAAYVQPGEPAIIDQLRMRLTDDWQATLQAVDGSFTSDVAQQLVHLPTDVSHLVVSVGGNDAIEQSHILSQPTHTIGTAMLELAQVRDAFVHEYDQMFQAVQERNLPTVLCTIYNPAEADPAFQRIATTALMVFNDHIIRAATRAGLPLIDLRLICTTPEDYANPIEPSAIGGEKIAAAIARAVTQHPFTQQQTVVYI